MLGETSQEPSLLTPIEDFEIELLTDSGILGFHSQNILDDQENEVLSFDEMMDTIRNSTPLPSEPLEEIPSPKATETTMLQTIDTPEVSRKLEWLPFSLSSIYLISLTFISGILGVSCIILASYSKSHNGVCEEGNSNGFRFSWRFLPTIVAIIYTLIWAPVMKDVVRTEPWALLSFPFGFKASESLLAGENWWWVDAFRAIKNRETTGGIRWAILVAISGSVIGSIVINPLSAGFLDVEDINTTKLADFSIIARPKVQVLFPSITDDTYIRAVSKTIYNISVSPWITDDFIVMPFWPYTKTSTSLQTSLIDTPQIWRTQTNVFKVEFNCKALLPTLKGSVNATNPTSGATLESDEGCTFPFSLEGGFWGQSNGSSTECGHQEYILLYSRRQQLSGVKSASWNSTAKGYTCTTTYLTANMEVAVSAASSGLTISVDKNNFNIKKQEMDSTFLDSKTFQASFIIGTEKQAINRTPNSFSTAIELKGPMYILGAQYGLSVDAMVNATDLVENARALKHQFFGESLMSVFSTLEESRNITGVSGTVSQIYPRLIVNFSIGITLGVLFLLLSIGTAALFFLTRLERRPLQLSDDPSKATTAALIMRELDTSRTFEGLERAPSEHIKTTLQEGVFRMRNGYLLRVGGNPAEGPSNLIVDKVPQRIHERLIRTMTFSQDKSGGKDWRPFNLRRGTGALLALFVASITAVLLTIYTLSQEGSGLHQAALVYESDISIGNRTITSFAPYSIIPTLVAVLVKLWWTSIDDTFRRLGPLLAMVQRAQKPNNGANLSYINSPILWITGVAVKKGHWLLAIVSFGTFAAELLQVGMSALWTRKPGVISQPINLTQTLEIRSVPHAIQRDTLSYAIQNSLYGGLGFHKSWLFHALVSSAYNNNSSPAWSNGRWSFPPVELSHVAKNISQVYNSSTPEMIAQDLRQTLNITLNSPAVSGRIECSPILDTNRWILTADLTNKTMWKDNPFNLSTGYELSSYIRFNGFKDQLNNSASTVSIGKWLTSDESIYSGEDYGDSNLTNFTIIWINSDHYPLRYLDYHRSVHLLFPNMPQIRGLSCMPIFEKAKAEITVNAYNGVVAKYTLLGDPENATEAWSHAFTMMVTNDTGISSSTRFSAISWGYLFQAAILRAYEDLSSSSRDSFYLQTSDLSSDFFSYSSLSAVKNNRSALLDYGTLQRVSQEVFSTFFRSFISFKNNDGDYWAYQSVGASLPYNLKPPATTTVERVNKIPKISTSTSFLLKSNGSISYLYPTAIPITHTTTTTTTETRLVYPGGTSLLPQVLPNIDPRLRTSTVTSTSSSLYKSATYLNTLPKSSLVPITSQVSVVNKVRSLETEHVRIDPGSNIPATLHIGSEELVVSSVSIFLSVGLLLCLLISTFIIYTIKYHHLKMLPRDIDMPASLLALVHCSEKLKAWAGEQNQLGKYSDSCTNTQSIKRDARKLLKKNDDNNILIGMGYFSSEDGKERWGIEIDAIKRKQR